MVSKYNYFWQNYNKNKILKIVSNDVKLWGITIEL